MCVRKKLATTLAIAKLAKAKLAKAIMIATAKLAKPTLPKAKLPTTTNHNKHCLGSLAPVS